MMRVVQAGFAVIDGEGGLDDSEDDGGAGMGGGVGRRRFGKVEKLPADSDSDSDSADTDASESSYDPTDPTAALIHESRREAAAQAHADRKAKKHAAKSEAAKLAESRRRKEVNLNIPLSGGLSGRGGISGRGGGAVMKCHKCGQGGHKAKECTRQGGGRFGGKSAGNGKGKRRLSGD